MTLMHENSTRGRSHRVGRGEKSKEFPDATVSGPRSTSMKRFPNCKSLDGGYQYVQSPGKDMYSDLEGFGNQCGFEGVPSGALETLSTEAMMIPTPPPRARAETLPRVEADGGYTLIESQVESRIRRAAASVNRYLAEEDGSVLCRVFMPPKDAPPHKQLFADLERLGLASREPTTGRRYKKEQSSRGAPQHRNVEQSLDEIAYLPSCG